MRASARSSLRTSPKTAGPLTFLPAATRSRMAFQTVAAPGTVKCSVLSLATAWAAMWPCVRTRPITHSSVSGSASRFSARGANSDSLPLPGQLGKLRQRHVLNRLNERPANRGPHGTPDGKPAHFALVPAGRAAKHSRLRITPPGHIHPVRLALGAEHDSNVVGVEVRHLPHPFLAGQPFPGTTAHSGWKP